MPALTKKELAALAGYTYRRLQDIDKGLPEDKKLFVEATDAPDTRSKKHASEHAGRYDAATFVQRWVDYNVERAKGKEIESLDDIKSAHEAVKMQKTELEVARMRGVLLDANEVQQRWNEIASNVTQAMIHLPEKIAPQIINMPDTHSIMAVIDREVRDALTELAGRGRRETEDEGEE